MEEVNVLNRWDDLPEECRSMILLRLTNKELARISRVSKEFLKAVTFMRSNVHLLVLPPSLSNSALEGMVAAHPNLKTLSFKRCGLKLKSFVPIIRAAATGFNSARDTSSKHDSDVCEKKKSRSLMSVDFRNCVHLLDTDVSLLCSLHTRLEEVDFTNCPCISDAALLTLSRYQHVEKPSNPLENFKCYPRFVGHCSAKILPEVTSDDLEESEEMFLKNNDAAVFEEIQGLAMNGNSYFRTWPRLGALAEKTRSSRCKNDDEKLLNSPYHSKRNESKGSARKSYAQMASESSGPKTAPSFGMTVSLSPETEASLSVRMDASGISRKEQEVTSSRSTEQIKVADAITQSPSAVKSMVVVPLGSEIRRPLVQDPTLTFIDWGDPSNALVPFSSKSIGELDDDVRRCFSVNSCTEPNELFSGEAETANKYHDMYKKYVFSGETGASTAVPALRDRLSQMNFGQISESIRAQQPHVDEKGTRYSTVKTTLNTDRVTMTQTSVFYSKKCEEDLQGSMSARRSFSACRSAKPVCVAGATEIKDERLDLSKRANCRAEAFCRTTNHVDLFAVSDVCPGGGADSAQSRLNEPLSNTSNSRESIAVSGSKVKHSSPQQSICLPGSMAVSNNKNRKSKHMNLVTSEPLCALSSDWDYVFNAGKDGISQGTSEADVSESKDSRGLKSVNVTACPEITDRGIQAVLKGALRSSLSVLDVSRCGGVTNAGLRIPARSALQQLIAVQMPGISRLVFQLPVQSQLRHLNLAGSYKLEELVLVSSALKSLNLASCKKLTRLQLKCSSLNSLNLSLCDSLERFVNFQCGELQTLNICGCRMLVQSAVNAAIEVAGSLQELRCGGCDRLERLDLVQPTLLTVEACGSQALRRLFCQSRVLKSVDASGCKSLGEVYLYSPYLRRMLFSNCALLQILVIPLDAIKETMDAAAVRSCRDKRNEELPDALEIAISGCNMPDGVKKNLGKLTKQWQSCFKSNSGS